MVEDVGKREETQIVLNKQEVVKKTTVNNGWEMKGLTKEDKRFYLPLPPVCPVVVSQSLRPPLSSATRRNQPLPPAIQEVSEDTAARSPP